MISSDAQICLAVVKKPEIDNKHSMSPSGRHDDLYHVPKCNPKGGPPVGKDRPEASAFLIAVHIPTSLGLPTSLMLIGMVGERTTIVLELYE
jgi:hypothetical protein